MAEHAKPDSRLHIGDMRPADIALLKDVAEVAAEQAVSKMLVAMGLDPSDPLEAQKDMAWVRSRREWSEKGMWHAVTVAITLTLGGIGVWVWTGFKIAVK